MTLLLSQIEIEFVLLRGAVSKLTEKLGNYCKLRALFLEFLAPFPGKKKIPTSRDNNCHFPGIYSSRPCRFVCFGWLVLVSLAWWVYFAFLCNSLWTPSQAPKHWPVVFFSGWIWLCECTIIYWIPLCWYFVEFLCFWAPLPFIS